jgi:hypothetical protein
MSSSIRSYPVTTLRTVDLTSLDDVVDTKPLRLEAAAVIEAQDTADISILRSLSGQHVTVVDVCPDGSVITLSGVDSWADYVETAAAIFSATSTSIRSELISYTARESPRLVWSRMETRQHIERPDGITAILDASVTARWSRPARRPWQIHYWHRVVRPVSVVRPASTRIRL